ncbi:MAG: NAD(P)-dependent oxidoreductase [Pelomonas sp.]|nr:NAD(P)-dependent oxidoreductase [Roseateles sp.]
MAAPRQAARRVVFASSAQTVEGYPLDYQVQERDPLRPRNLYGVSKCFGEALAACFSDAEGLSCIVVRIAHCACFKPSRRPGRSSATRRSTMRSRSSAGRGPARSGAEAQSPPARLRHSP